MSQCAESPKSPAAASSHPVCVSGWEKGTCPLQGCSLCLARAGSTQALSVQESRSWGCRAAGEQSIAFCSSTPATTRSPQLRAQAQPAQQLESPCTPSIWQREPRLGCASTLLLPDSLCRGAGSHRQELPLPVAEEGLGRVLTLWLLQCVTVAWFSEREGRRAPSALQPLSCCSQRGHAELTFEPWSRTPRTLFCMGCLHPSPSPPPA